VERKSRSGSHTDSVLLAAPDADGEIRRREVGTDGRGGGAGGRLVPDVSRASAEAHASPGAARSPCGGSGANCKTSKVTCVVLVDGVAY
jgi:hypothetical protein